MDFEEKNLMEILNKLLEENGKKITSVDELSNFNFIFELIKSM
jgi:hypothetical protein